MQVLVTGAGGMLGRKLVDRLTNDGVLGDKRISELVLVDVAGAQPATDGDIDIQWRTADLAEPGVAEAVVSGAPGMGR